MKKLFQTLIPLFFVLAVLGSTKQAHALGPVGLEAGAIVGYGTNPDSNAPTNLLGVGIGARAGVVLLDSLYGGVKIVDYLGGSSDGVSYHSLQYGVDVGYGFSIPLLTIRPQVGIGSIGFTGSEGGVSATNSSVYIEPGVVGLIGLGILYVGADVNYMFIPSFPDGPGTTKGEGSLTIHGQIGIKL
jgi:hypothetical protein